MNETWTTRIFGWINVEVESYASPKEVYFSGQDTSSDCEVLTRDFLTVITMLLSQEKIWLG